MAETAISVYSHMTGEMECNAAKKMDDALGRMTLAVPAKVNISGTGYTSVTGSAKAFYGYNSSGQPSSVLTGLSNTAYVRPDGVFVVPVTALKK